MMLDTVVHSVGRPEDRIPRIQTDALIEPGKKSSVGEWADARAAEAEIAAVLAR
jgi:hypothetical protein